MREIGNVTLPRAIRETKLYQNMVESTLRFLVEQVGQVDNVYPAESALAEKFLLKRAVGDGIDFIGIVAFHASPVWILAALADISGTGKQLVGEISSSLKEEGLLDKNANFETVDQLLDGLEHTAGQLATSLRFPPLDVASLRKEWSSLREAAASMPPPNLPSAAFVQAQWDELKQAAASQHRTVLELSSVMALSAIRALPANLLWLSRCARTATFRTGQFFAQGLFDHYSATLGQIRDAGFLSYWKSEFRPYLRAAAAQFSPARQSSTERLLRKRHA